MTLVRHNPREEVWVWVWVWVGTRSDVGTQCAQGLGLVWGGLEQTQGLVWGGSEKTQGLVWGGSEQTQGLVRGGSEQTTLPLSLPNWLRSQHSTNCFIKHLFEPPLCEC